MCLQINKGADSIKETWRNNTDRERWTFIERLITGACGRFDEGTYGQY